MDLSRRRLMRAECSCLEVLDLAGLWFLRVWLICNLTSSATGLASWRKAGSVAWMTSSAVDDLGTRAKFSSSERTLVSIGDNCRWLKLTTVCLMKAAWERRWGLDWLLPEDIDDPVGLVVGCCRDLNFLICWLRILLKVWSLLVLVSCRILLRSSGERNRIIFRPHSIANVPKS